MNIISNRCSQENVSIVKLELFILIDYESKHIRDHFIEQNKQDKVPSKESYGVILPVLCRSLFQIMMKKGKIRNRIIADANRDMMRVTQEMKSKGMMEPTSQELMKI